MNGYNPSSRETGYTSGEQNKKFFSVWGAAQQHAQRQQGMRRRASQGVRRPSTFMATAAAEGGQEAGSQKLPIGVHRPAALQPAQRICSGAEGY